MHRTDVTKLRSIDAAVKLAARAARNGYFTTVYNMAQDDTRNRDKYGNHPHRGYLAVCEPARKRGKSYAKCKIARKIVAKLRREERSL